MKKVTKEENIWERRAVSISLNAVLFMTNFFLVYFIWLLSAPEISGLGRLTVCWVAAYGLTWMMTYVTKGAVRLVLAILLLGVLAFVMTSPHAK
jgi:hypothetical protein